ncbi:sulfotransferase family protein [Psychroflexus tropicus]|uniref:sulfotransferase family protein n=1 Tax=Psychroflexus tropicus TaxID=197345 RepID=UPI00039F7E89|nr:sulfotransferase [Psychroflexus tropicus]
MFSSKKHLFVIGNPRSGTSLFRIMLNSHSKMTIPPECGFIHWWYEKYKSWDKEYSISNFVTDLKTSKKIETWDLDFSDLERFLQKEVPQDYKELVFKITEFYGHSKLNKADQHVLGDKNNYYIKHLKEIKEISPEAFFIFLIRDPKAVFSSYKEIQKLKTDSSYKPDLSLNVTDFIEEWLKNHKNILDFINGLKKNKFLIVSYEQLVVKTEDELRRTSKFLDLRFESEMLNYYKTNDEPSGLLDWKQKTLQPPDQTSIIIYKERLTRDEIFNIEAQTNSLFNCLLNQQYLE